MRAYYGERGENPAVLHAMGLPPDEIKRRVAAGAAPLAIWPENATAFRVFAAMETQWRHGPSGRTGLEYSALPAVMRLVGVGDTDEQAVFATVREMEAEALAIFAERRARG